MVLTALLVLAACAAGVGLGYAVSRPTAPTIVPSTATTTTPTSPKVAAIAATVDPGLVDVNTTLTYQTASGAGTGMVISSSGEIVTNNHVIEGETSLHVTDVGNGKTYTASVIGYDMAADVAVLQVSGTSRLHTVSFAVASPPRWKSETGVGSFQAL